MWTHVVKENKQKTGVVSEVQESLLGQREKGETMKIADLEKDTKVINLVGTITVVKPAEISVTGKKVQEAVVQDDSGQVLLKLWEDNVDAFKVGDKVIMTTGWCGMFEEEIYITPGKFGKINKVPPEKPE